MPTKTGAGGKPQEYDESTGQFGSGSGTTHTESQLSGKGTEYRQNTDYKELTSFFLGFSAFILPPLSWLVNSL